MPADAAAVGVTTAPLPVVLEARWLMSYAAGLGHAGEHHLDAARPGGVVAHPVFSVAPEWVLRVDPERRIDLGMSDDEFARSVHAGHAIRHRRPIRADEEVELTATISGVEETKAGARVTSEFQAVDATAAVVWTSVLVSVYRGVAVTGTPQAPPRRPRCLADDAGAVTKVRELRRTPVGLEAAHVYTECARIWNPIHTDSRAAAAAGLPAPILHGTATLAHGVDAVLTATGSTPRDVVGLDCAFRSMVTPPTTLVTELRAVSDGGGGRSTYWFEVRDGPSGRVVLADAGLVVERRAGPPSGSS